LAVKAKQLGKLYFINQPAGRKALAASLSLAKQIYFLALKHLFCI